MLRLLLTGVLAALAQRGAALNFGQLFGGGGGQKKAPLTNQEIREKYGVQLPSYDVLADGDGWECRRYQKMSLTECEYTVRPEGASLPAPLSRRPPEAATAGYELLGGYQAGAENSLNLAMPPTSPALIIPFDSPKRMRFVLP